MEKKILPATGEPTSLAGMMQQAFEQIGLTMISDDHAGQLLAYTYVCGGGNEAVVLHPGLNAGIKMAQQKANLYGGCIPNYNIVQLINKYIHELEDAVNLLKHTGVNESQELPKLVPWLDDLYKRYELGIYAPKQLKKKK